MFLLSSSIMLTLTLDSDQDWHHSLKQFQSSLEQRYGILDVSSNSGETDFFIKWEIFSNRRMYNLVVASNMYIYIHLHQQFALVCQKILKDSTWNYFICNLQYSSKLPFNIHVMHKLLILTNWSLLSDALYLITTYRQHIRSKYTIND